MGEIGPTTKGENAPLETPRPGPPRGQSFHEPMPARPANLRHRAWSPVLGSGFLGLFSLRHNLNRNTRARNGGVQQEAAVGLPPARTTRSPLAAQR